MGCPPYMSGKPLFRMTYILLALAAREVEQKVELEVVEGPAFFSETFTGELLQGVLVTLGCLLDSVLLQNVNTFIGLAWCM